MRLTTLAAVALCLALTAACAVPLAVGTPQSPVTAGDGQFKADVAMELPSPDIVRDNADNSATDNAFPQTAFPTFDVRLAYGAGDQVDVEVAISGVFLLIAYLPTGVSLGARYQLIDSRDGGKVDFSVAGRGGFVGISLSTDDGANETAAAAVYGAGSATLMLGGDFPLRALLSAEVMPLHVWGDLDDSPAEGNEFRSYLVSGTFAIYIPFVRGDVAPYVTAARLMDSPFGPSEMVVGGLLFVQGHKKKPPRPGTAFMPAPGPSLAPPMPTPVPAPAPEPTGPIHAPPPPQPANPY